MKDGKELDKEQIHRLLDGDLGPDEKKALMARVQADPVLREEFEGLTGALRAIETSEKMPAPSFFTAEVMRRLPPGKATVGQQVWNFLFKGRALKWNMATAFAATAILALIFTQVVRTGHAPVETAAVSQQEQLVTVTMNLHAPEAHHVSVAGTFNKWKADANVLTKQENGIWTISIPLKPGEYTYNFMVDSKPIRDPNNRRTASEGRSLLVVEPLPE